CAADPALHVSRIPHAAAGRGDDRPGDRGTDGTDAWLGASEPASWDANAARKAGGESAKRGAKHGQSIVAAARLPRAGFTPLERDGRRTKEAKRANGQAGQREGP